jgi:hypothetical protein
MGASNKANALVEDIQKSASQKLIYYLQGKAINRHNMSNEVQLQIYLMQELIRITEKYNTPLHNKLVANFPQIF